MEELAGLGVSVYTCGRSAESLATGLQAWREQGLKVDGSVCDLSVREAREELFRNVETHFGGKLDILVRKNHSSLLEMLELNFEMLSMYQGGQENEFLQENFPITQRGFSSRVRPLEFIIQ